MTDADLAAGRRQFVEFYGSMAVMNTFLKIAVVLLCLIDVAQMIVNISLSRSLRSVKPIIVRIDDVGRAEPLGFTAQEYRPQPREIRFFLTQFVERHYSRMRATLRDNYARSLYFLDGRLANSLIDA